nr:MAG TPA: hypothetical protein [Caudoviricetes sp.]
MPTLEKDNQLVDIDPFTVFSLFNKSSMKESNRIKILSAVADLLTLSQSLCKPKACVNHKCVLNKFSNLWVHFSAFGDYS